MRVGPLEPGDLRRLAVVAFLTGREAESTEAWEHAHHAFLRAGEVQAAVQCAFWLAFALLLRGERARGGGWLARAKRQLDTLEEECVEQGYVLFPVGFQRISAGDPEGAQAIFSQAAQIAGRFGDLDLATLARTGEGRALLRMGRTQVGLRLLDEVMVAVTTSETSPIVAGTVYCTVIEGCREMFDVQRAQEWTTVLTAWCEQQPDLVPYRGQCLVHRSQLSQLRGEWAQALEEVRRACERLSDPPGQPALGMAWYQQGELDRLRGALDAAEEAYRRASEHGHVPQPGGAGAARARGDRGRGGGDPPRGGRGRRGPHGARRTPARPGGDRAVRR